MATHRSSQLYGPPAQSIAINSVRCLNKWAVKGTALGNLEGGSHCLTE